MRMYRLAEGINADGLPFLFEGHAYLADGTPLTECDRYGRIVPALGTLIVSKATCSGGTLRLVDRSYAIEALARALDCGDLVRAPLLLLQLQVDPNLPLAKFNLWHKPPGPGGGQFTSGPETSSAMLHWAGIEQVSLSPNDEHPFQGQTGEGAGFEQVGQSLNVDVTSDWVNGVFGPEMDKAHAEALALVRFAITVVTRLGFQPGSPGYGQELDLELRNLISRLQAMGSEDAKKFTVQPVYFGGSLLPGKGLPAGSSAPDLAYGPPDHPLMVIDVKSGRSALNLNGKDNREQKERTMKNVPDTPIYQYFQVFEK